MAPANRSNSGKFKKGKSGNPSGRPALSPQEKVVKVLTREKFAELVQLIMTQKKEGLEDLIAQGLPYEEELFIRHMLALGENPDWSQYERYLSRRIGKVTDELMLTVPPATVIERRDGSQVVIGRKGAEEQDD